MSACMTSNSMPAPRNNSARRGDADPSTIPCTRRSLHALRSLDRDSCPSVSSRRAGGDSPQGAAHRRQGRVRVALVGRTRNRSRHERDASRRGSTRDRAGGRMGTGSRTVGSVNPRPARFAAGPRCGSSDRSTVDREFAIRRGGPFRLRQGTGTAERKREGGQVGLEQVGLKQMRQRPIQQRPAATRPPAISIGCMMSSDHCARRSASHLSSSFAFHHRWPQSVHDHSGHGHLSDGMSR